MFDRGLVTALEHEFWPERSADWYNHGPACQVCHRLALSRPAATTGPALNRIHHLRCVVGDLLIAGCLFALAAQVVITALVMLVTLGHLDVPWGWWWLAIAADVLGWWIGGLILPRDYFRYRLPMDPR